MPFVYLFCYSGWNWPVVQPFLTWACLFWVAIQWGQITIQWEDIPDLGQDVIRWPGYSLNDAAKLNLEDGLQSSRLPSRFSLAEQTSPSAKSFRRGVVFSQKLIPAQHRPYRAVWYTRQSILNSKSFFHPSERSHAFV